MTGSWRRLRCAANSDVEVRIEGKLQMPIEETGRITVVEGAKRTLVGDKLAHPATVSHETMAGDKRRFEVTIESVFYREEGGTARLAFRGKASSGTWAGYKTFFADECHDLVYGTTGLSVTDVSSWLFGLQDDVTPMTLLSLANAIIGFLEREFGIDIGKLYSNLTDAGTTLVYGKITSPDEKPPFENLFCTATWRSGGRLRSYFWCRANRDLCQ